MLPVNLLARVRGAATLHYKGQDFWTKDVAAFDFDFKPVDVESDAYGPLDSRASGRIVTVKFTPVGAWTPGQIAVLFPYLNPRLGDFNTPVRILTAVDDVHSNLTSPDHGQITGTGVRVAILPGGTLPTGIAANTTYYLWCNADGNTVQLYGTEAQALAADGVDNVAGQIAITSVGAGTIGFIVNTPLIITTQDGVKLTLWNAAVTEQPDGSFGPKASVLKSVTFEAYTLHGQLWSDANSIYTYGSGVITAQQPNAAQIPTVPYQVDWATRLPIEAVNTGTGSLEVPNHGLATGAPVSVDVLSAGAALPAPLAPCTTYYAIVIDASDLKLATTLDNAQAGTSIALTSAGAGEMNLITGIEAKGISPREAVDISHKASWSEVESSGNGLDCRSLKGMETTVEFVPTNLAYQTLLNAIEIQGVAGSAPGQSLPSADLDIYGPGETPFIRVYGASLQNSPARFGAQADRVDKLKFMSKKRVFEGGVVMPIAYVGTQAPTS